jgi:hypothetical protein
MENELEDGTRATFISRHSHPSLCSVRHRLCAAPMPVTTPRGPEAYSLSSSIPAGDTYQAFSWPRKFSPASQHQFADGERREPCRHEWCPGQWLGAYWPRLA